MIEGKTNFEINETILSLVEYYENKKKIEKNQINLFDLNKKSKSKINL